MKNLLERIKPEHLEILVKSKALSFSFEDFLREYTKVNDMIIEVPLRIGVDQMAEVLKVDIKDLGTCFDIGVIKVNDRISVDYTDDTQVQAVSLDAEIEIDDKMYTLVADGTVLLTFDKVKETETFIEFDALDYHITHQDHDIVIDDCYDSEIEKLVIDYCVTP